MVTTRAGVPGEIKPVPLFRVSTQESLDAPIDRRAESYRVQALERLKKEGHGKLKPQPLLTPPNVLTFARLVMVPLFAVLWFLDHKYAPISTAATFIAAAVTDWLDGFLARKMKITSAFGAFLDPVADKIMVSTALVLLAQSPPEPISNPAMLLPVVVMIAREIAMSSLREWAATSGGGAHKAVKVNSLGKWKTALQLVAMSLLLLLRHSHQLLGEDGAVLVWIDRLTRSAFALLWVAAALATLSLANYFRMVWSFFRYPGGRASDH